MRLRLAPGPPRDGVYALDKYELEADSDGSGADKLMDRMAKMKPEPRTKPSGE